jgi:molecular chaperone DnaK
MTSLVVAVEVGATHLSFAYGEPAGSGPPTAGRLPRAPRSVAPSWHTGASLYVDPGPATAELRSLHSTICADGVAVARFALVCPDRPDRPGPQAPPSWIANQPSAAKFLQKVMGGATSNWGQPYDWGQTRNWVVEAGFPEPTIVGKAAAAAQQIGDSASQASRVLVIDIGARAATTTLVARAGEHFELAAPAREVPTGGDRVDLHIAWFAMGANPEFNALKTAHDPLALESFFASVRDAKHELSTADKATVRASVNGAVIEADIWRDWLDQPVAADIQAIATAAGPLLAMRPDVVLLVGDGAKFPAVAKSLRAAIPQQLEVAATAGLAAGGLKQVLAVPPMAAEVPIASTPQQAHSGWILGIDFGTTYTVAAVATAGRTRPIDVDRQGSLKMPSSVVRIEDGTLVVGKQAVNQAVLFPTSFVGTPKRDIGRGIKLMGGEAIPVVDLIAAVLKRCGDEVRKQQGTEPAAVRLTHPAKWSGPRLEVLREAARKAGLDEPELIAEPVAAASMLPKSVAQAGKPIAIYDFGGGTFDAAVLVPTANGTFAVAGVPGGRDPLGGEDIDNRIIDYLGDGPLGQRPEWAALMTSEEAGWSRHRDDLRARVRDAKEQLSQQYEATIWIAGLRENHQLTRVGLQELIDKDVDDTVTELESTIRAAGFSPQDLGGIYLIGGSSQLLLVTEKIVDRLGIEPHPIAADAKTVVAEGAALWAPRALTRQGTHRPCRLGARPFAVPGVTYRVEHLLSIDAESASVLSSPNRWLSLEGFVAEQQQRDMQQGIQFGLAQPGGALGADGATLFPTTAADGRACWSSYQLIGEWAIRGRWLQDAAGIEQIRVIGDRTRWSAVRSVVEFADRDGIEPVETITIYARPGRIPVDVVASARSEPLTEEHAANWLQLFFYQLIKQTQGKVDPPLETAFCTGAPCKAVKYRGSGKRGWCWYGIVNQRGVSITIEAPLAMALPMQLALTLRDAIIFE